MRMLMMMAMLALTLVSGGAMASDGDDDCSGYDYAREIVCRANHAVDDIVPSLSLRAVQADLSALA